MCTLESINSWSVAGMVTAAKDAVTGLLPVAKTAFTTLTEKFTAKPSVIPNKVNKRVDARCSFSKAAGVAWITFVMVADAYKGGNSLKRRGLIALGSQSSNSLSITFPPYYQALNGGSEVATTHLDLSAEQSFKELFFVSDYFQTNGRGPLIVSANGTLPEGVSINTPGFKPKKIISVPGLPATAAALAFEGSYVYTSTNEGNQALFCIFNLDSDDRISAITVPKTFSNVCVVGDICYGITEGLNCEIIAINCRDKQNPRIVGSKPFTDTDYYKTNFFVVNNQGFLLSSGTGFRRFDLSNPSQIELSEVIAFPQGWSVGDATKFNMLKDGNRALVPLVRTADNVQGFWELNFEDVTNITNITLPFPGVTEPIYGYLTQGNGHIYCLYNQLSVFKNNGTLSYLRSLDLSLSVPMGLTFSNLLFIIDQGTVVAYDVSDPENPVYTTGNYEQTVTQIFSHNNDVVIKSYLALGILDNRGDQFSVTGVPGPRSQGRFHPQLVARDRAGNAFFATQNLDLEVEPAIEVLTTLPDQFAVVDERFEFDVELTKRFKHVNNNDQLTYDATFDNPLETISFNGPSGVFSGKPTEENLGTYIVTLIAEDSEGAEATITFRLYVVNKPKLNMPIADVTVKIDRPYNLRLSRQLFANSNALNFSLITNDGLSLPSWITFDASNLNITMAPTVANLGILGLDLVAEDPNGIKNNAPFRVNIVNDAPLEYSTPLAPPKGSVGEPWEFIIPQGTITDPYGEFIRYSAICPEGFSFDPVTLRFSGTPKRQWSNNAPLRFTLTGSTAKLNMQLPFDLVSEGRTIFDLMLISISIAGTVFGIFKASPFVLNKLVSWEFLCFKKRWWWFRGTVEINPGEPFPTYPLKTDERKVANFTTIFKGRALAGGRKLPDYSVYSTTDNSLIAKRRGRENMVIPDYFRPVTIYVISPWGFITEEIKVITSLKFRQIQLPASPRELVVEMGLLKSTQESTSPASDDALLSDKSPTERKYPVVLPNAGVERKEPEKALKEVSPQTSPEMQSPSPPTSHSSPEGVSFV